jgi:cell wall-associated NlpC family hydrolase
MPVYDDVMAGSSGAAAPGTEAVTAPGIEEGTAPIVIDLVDGPDHPGESVFEKTMGKSTSAMSGGVSNPGFGKDSSKTGKILSLAKSFVGTPYVWGGMTPQGFDCSGFLQYIFGKVGVKIPRLSYQQATYGTLVGLNSLKPGDIIGWDVSARNNGADHVGLYLGGGMIAEAPRPGVPLRIRKLDPTGYDKGAWVRRVL